MNNSIKEITSITEIKNELTSIRNRVDQREERISDIKAEI